MLRWFIVLLIVIPALEIWGLITVGNHIGAWQTLCLIIITGVLGAYLARREARRVWNELGNQIQYGRMPSQSILDAVCIFTGGLLLLTPGFFTDALGLILVFPWTRRMIRGLMLNLLRRLASNSSIQMFYRR